jgi:hypothetical protein
LLGKVPFKFGFKLVPDPARGEHRAEPQPQGSQFSHLTS